MGFLAILFFILIPVCSFLAYRKAYSKGVDVGCSYSENENASLRKEVSRLKESVEYWSAQANGAFNHQQNIVNSYNLNVHNSLGAVLQLLQGVKSSSNSSLSQEDRDKVDKMIEQAKGLV